MSKARMEGIENKADVAERITLEISAANSPLLRVALITGMFYLLLELLLLAEVRSNARTDRSRLRQEYGSKPVSRRKTWTAT